MLKLPVQMMGFNYLMTGIKTSHFLIAWEIMLVNFQEVGLLGRTPLYVIKWCHSGRPRGPLGTLGKNKALRFKCFCSAADKDWY